ncbi:SPEC3/Stum [Trinorchestia longiramus]|nr:SPEC3/Stum [Trinorchestia longiramus]
MRRCGKPLKRRKRRVSEHVHRNYLKIRQMESVSVIVTPPDQEQTVPLTRDSQKHDRVSTELPDEEEDSQIAIDVRQNSGSPPRHSAAPEVRMDSGGPGSPVFGGSKKEPKVPIVLMQGVFNRAAANTSLGRRAALEVEQLPLPPFLVEPTSRLRGALPVLPPSFASLCLCLNVCIPGLGTMVSGWLGLCVGRNRLAPQETPRTRGMSVLITMGTGLAQLAAVSFFLVGWFWSIAWGLLLVSISQKYLMYIDDHAKTMQGAVGLEMMSVNANAPDKANS